LPGLVEGTVQQGRFDRLSDRFALMPELVEGTMKGLSLRQAQRPEKNTKSKKHVTKKQCGTEYVDHTPKL
jgi:hypothetical protein